MLKNQNNGELVLVMSARAKNALSKEHRTELCDNYTIIAPDVGTIEKVSGTSVRSMIAEIF